MLPYTPLLSGRGHSPLPHPPLCAPPFSITQPRPLHLISPSYASDSRPCSLPFQTVVAVVFLPGHAACPSKWWLLWCFFKPFCPSKWCISKQVPFQMLTLLLHVCVISLLALSNDMERSIRKWVLWILFYKIKFKSIYLPKKLTLSGFYF